MAKKIQLQDANGNVLHPLTLGECVTMSNGENLDTLMSKSQMFTPTIAQNKSMFKVGTGVDVDYSANVKDGAYESLVFKGKSLVNLWKKHDTHNQRNFTLYEDGFMETVPNVLYFDHIQKANTEMIKPNTKYLLIVEVVKNTLPVPISFQSDNRTYFYGNSGTMFGAGETGVVKKIITSISDLSTTRDDLRWGAYIQFAQNNVSESERGVVKIRQMLIEYQQGMENWDIPYFTGICDSKMPILRNIGKNLLDPQTFIPLDKGVEYVRYEDGYVLANFTNANTHFFYKVDLARLPKGMYTVIAKHEGERSYLGIQHTFKDGTKTWGKTQFNNDGSYAELGLYMQSTTNDPSLKVKAKIMLVANGDTTSPYEDYKTNILRTSEEIVLREVGGVCDTYNPLTGEYTKRIGEKVLCGETVEDWRDFRNTFIEKTETIDVYLINPEQKSNSNLLCDKMRTTSKGVYMNDEEGISCSGGNGLNVWVSISKNKLSTPNKEGFKQWLQSNPLTVQYELAEPVTTIVKPSTMTPFAYQNGHVILESGFEGQSLLPEIEYSVVTGRTGQVTQNTKVLRKQEQQIIGLEELLLTQVVQMEYERTLLQFDYELQMMMLG